MATYNITYQQLLNSIHINDYNIGDKFRITDYVTTVDDTYRTIQDGGVDIPMARSLGHPFDVIVTVIAGTGTNKQISIEATAAPHEGDTYFSEEDLSQWQLLYKIDDGFPSLQDEYEGREMSELAPWALDEGNGGKGAIFWMQDEHGNEAGFDFKNIQFRRYIITGNLAVSPSYSGQAQHEFWAQKIKDLFAKTTINQNFALYVHCFLDYIEESNLPVQNWEDIYITTDTGTRMFVVLEKDADGQPIMIAQVGTAIWCHLFGKVTSTSATETTDLTLGGSITDAVMISQEVDNDYVLPMSIVIAYGTATVGTANIQQLCLNSTINAGFTLLEINSSLLNSVLMNFVTLYIEGICESIVIMNATGSRAIYATEYDVLYVSVPNYWRIPFASMNETSYEVRIYGAEGNSPITLQGGSNPINTEEDKTEEISYPLRTQSGYIRIVAEPGFDYSELLPEYNMSRFVELRQGNIIRWRGFLKAQNFNINYLDYRVSVNLPIIDPLTILDSVDFAPSIQQGRINLAGILFYCFSILQIYEYSHVDSIYIDNEDAWFGNNAWMRAVVSTMSFYNTDDEGNLTVKYSCKEVLTNMMTMLGMSLRMSGINVFITSCFNHGKTGSISLDSLKTIADGTAITGMVTDVRELNFPSMFKGTNNYMKLLQGCRSAVVSCEQNLQDKSWGIPSDELADKYYATNTPVQTVVHPTSDLQGNLYTLVNQQAIAYKNKDFIFRPYTGEYLLIWEFQETSPNYTDMGPYYRWTVGLEHSAGSNYHFYVKTKYPVYLKNCIINIVASGGIYRDGYIDTSGATQYIRMILKVGNWKYDHFYKKWSTDPQNNVAIAFTKGKQEDTRILNSKDANYEGYGAIVNATTLADTGQDYLFDFLEIEVTGTTSNFVITGLNISILPNVKSGEDYSGKKEYKIDTQNIFSKKISKNLIFLPSNIETPVQNQVIGLYTSGGADYDPCQALVENLIAYGSKTHKLYHLELPKQNMTPTDVIEDANGKKYSPISISRKWVDDKDEVILMEIN